MDYSSSADKAIQRRANHIIRSGRMGMIATLLLAFMVMTACTDNDDLVVVSTKNDLYTINEIAPDYAAKLYQQAEVTADMAKFRYQELCFVFDNLFALSWSRTEWKRRGSMPPWT